MPEERNLIDETFDFNKSKQYSLSILLKKNGLSFVILDETLKKIIVWKSISFPKYVDLEEFLFHLKKVLKTEPFANTAYQSTRIVFQTHKSLTIPNDLYSEEYVESFVNLHLGLSKDEIVLSNEIQNLNAKKVFVINKVLFDIFNNHFSNWMAFHASVPVIENTLNSLKEDRVNLILNEDYFDLQIIKNEALVLDNAFLFKENEDALYYLLYTFEQHGIDVKSVNVIAYLSDDYSKDLLDLLNQYILKITESIYPKDFSYSYLLTKDLSSFLASQILVFKCEL